MPVTMSAQKLLTLLLVEEEERERAKMAVEAPKYDFFGPDCDCPPEARFPATDCDCPPDTKDEGRCTLGHKARGCAVHQRARLKQMPPPGDWLVWLLLMGRGYGKSRVGSEWTIDMAKNGPKGCRIAIVGQQASDVRDIMIEGESGILAKSPPWFRPKYLWSKRRLEWPNGAIGLCYSSEEPGQFRGPQFHAAWIDELAKFSYVDECWDNLQFGLRLAGDGSWVPRVCVTTTPIPIPIIKRLRKDSDTVYVTGSMYENIANLAKTFVAKIKARYEGSRLGRQEIHAEVLEDNPHALWSTAVLDANRLAAYPDLVRVVVAIDPSVNDPSTVMDESRAAECGITVGGVSGERHGFLIEDVSMRGKPNDWARAAVAAYHRHKADLIVAEGNNGGAMITSLLQTIDPAIPVSIVHASRGKYTRAEPVASLDEQGKIHHVGYYPELEEQMVTWMPGMASPDRMDSRVWLFTHLLLDGTPLEAGDSPWGEEWRGS